MDQNHTSYQILPLLKHQIHAHPHNVKERLIVDPEGHDPPTFGLWVRCSYQLSYGSIIVICEKYKND